MLLVRIIFIGSYLASLGLFLEDTAVFKEISGHHGSRAQCLLPWSKIAERYLVSDRVGRQIFNDNFPEAGIFKQGSIQDELFGTQQLNCVTNSQRKVIHRPVDCLLYTSRCV